MSGRRKPDLQVTLTGRQGMFVKATADEVLFGGAAGGGKSFGQLADALVFAARYPRSRQLVLRRTLRELEMSLIRDSFALYPADIGVYHGSEHVWRFHNGSIVEFGYCGSDADVHRYQSVEYDVVRFDELTHFTEYMYLYLQSRVRGTNGYPKQMKSTTNPGGIGHGWVKARFIDSGAPERVQRHGNGTRLFIPARVTDNPFLCQRDPGYVKRLQNLPAKERRTLLEGDWNVLDGQFFSEWDENIHVVKAFPLPAAWPRYFAMDYGLDMLAGYWIAVDEKGNAWVYKEVYEKGLVISEAAGRIREMTGERVELYIAPPDLWNRRQDTGRSAADIFRDSGIELYKAQNDRVQGWYEVREWLKPTQEKGVWGAKLRVFDNCANLIRCMPALCHDSRDPNDAARDPHEVTHGPDAIRYFCAARPLAAEGQASFAMDGQLGALLGYGQ